MWRLAAMKEQQERARRLIKGGSMGMQVNPSKNITVGKHSDASQLPSKLVAIVADMQKVSCIWKGLHHWSLQKLHSTLSGWTGCGPWSNLGCSKGNRSDGDRCSSTKRTTTPYGWILAPRLELRIHLGYRYQSSSSCHEEPHSHSTCSHAALHISLVTTRSNGISQWSKFFSFDFTKRDSRKIACYWTTSQWKIWEAIAVETVKQIPILLKKWIWLSLVKNTVKEVRWVTIGDYCWALWWYSRR